LIVILLALALVFDFLNGMHDSSNIVAGVISSRAMLPKNALALSAVANFIGPFLFGVAVAKTVGDGLLNIDAIDLNVVTAALTSAILWNVITWYFGLPSSSSHALIGGLLGGAILADGFKVVQLGGLLKIIITLLISPLLGMVVGFVFIRLILWLFRKATPNVNVLFRRVQILTLLGLGLSHGANDAQKTMGVLTLGLVLMGRLPAFNVPLWVITVSASAIALGTAIGGWRLIRTLGGKIFRIRPVHAFSSQVAGSAVILSAAIFGGPVSTTQVMSSAIVGVGAGHRMNMVRWQVLGDMVVAWLFTIPLTAGLSALLFIIFEAF
jgi:PiT family inorganic phosphate transporter